ncbi:hypothetical protein FKM82_005149 [Ascaphus truei]
MLRSFRFYKNITGGPNLEVTHTDPKRSHAHACIKTAYVFLGLMGYSDTKCGQSARCHFSGLLAGKTCRGCDVMTPFPQDVLCYVFIVPNETLSL